MNTNHYYVYIATNKNNTVLYTGMTNNLLRRIFEHKHKYISGFTSRYNIVKLVYFEVYIDVNEALKREKQIKAGSRRKKMELITGINSKWKDLYDGIASG